VFKERGLNLRAAHLSCGRNVGAISKEGEDNGAADLLESDEEDDALAKLADR
jgi:hypothetical protein